MFVINCDVQENLPHSPIPMHYGSGSEFCGVLSILLRHFSLGHFRFHTQITRMSQRRLLGQSLASLPMGFQHRKNLEHARMLWGWAETCCLFSVSAVG